jgi:hypothetical protein
MIWYNHVDLIIEHREIKQAYNGSCRSIDGTPGTNNSINNDEEQEAIMEQEGDNDGEDSVGAGARNSESEYLPKRQLWAGAQKGFSEEEENDDSTTGVNPEEEYHNIVLSRI